MTYLSTWLLSFARSYLSGQWHGSAIVHCKGRCLSHWHAMLAARLIHFTVRIVTVHAQAFAVTPSVALQEHSGSS
jgi:hypothetical protein